MSYFLDWRIYYPNLTEISIFFEIQAEVIFVTPVTAGGSVNFCWWCKFLKKKNIFDCMISTKSSFLIYLCFFLSQNCSTSSCLNQKCQNYWYLLIYAYKLWVKGSQISHFTGVKFFALKYGCVNFLTNIMFESKKPLSSGHRYRGLEMK